MPSSAEGSRKFSREYKEDEFSRDLEEVVVAASKTLDIPFDKEPSTKKLQQILIDYYEYRKAALSCALNGGQEDRNNKMIINDAIAQRLSTYDAIGLPLSDQHLPIIVLWSPYINEADQTDEHYNPTIIDLATVQNVQLDTRPSLSSPIKMVYMNTVRIGEIDYDLDKLKGRFPRSKFILSDPALLLRPVTKNMRSNDRFLLQVPSQ